MGFKGKLAGRHARENVGRHLRIGKLPKMALEIHLSNYHYVPKVGRSLGSIMLYLMGGGHTAGRV